MMLAVTAVVLAGCGERHLEAEMNDLQGRVAELSRQVTDAHVRIEELNNRVYLLQETSPNRDRDAVVRPPEDLKTIKLVPKAHPDEKPGSASKPLTSRAVPDNNHTNASNPPVLISNWPASSDLHQGKAVADRKARGSVKRDYEQALAMARSGQYAVAIEAFSDFLRAHGDNDYRDNALFWTGICFFEQGEYDLAIGEFNKVIAMAGANKTADALLYKGQSYREKGDATKAAELFHQVVSRFAGSAAARKAEGLLAGTPTNP